MNVQLYRIMANYFQSHFINLQSTQQWTWIPVDSYYICYFLGFLMCTLLLTGLPWWHKRWKKKKKEIFWLQCRKPRFNPWVRKTPWRRERQPTPVFLSRVHGVAKSWTWLSNWTITILSEDLQYHFHYNTKVPFIWGFVSSISTLFSLVNSSMYLLQAVYKNFYH